MALLESHPESAVAPELRRPQLLLGKPRDKLAPRGLDGSSGPVLYQPSLPVHGALSLPFQGAFVSACSPALF